MSVAQAVSTYFFKEEPKQFFVGAELCARWYQGYQVLKGQPAPKSTDVIITYCQDAQEVFSWITAGRSITSLVGRVVELKWDAETTALISDAVAQSAACGDIVINKLFESKVPRFKVLGFVTDMISDLLDASSLYKAGYNKKFLAGAKTITSLFITIVSMGLYFGVQTYILPRVSLVLETTVFVVKIVRFSIEFKNNNNSN